MDVNCSSVVNPLLYKSTFPDGSPRIIHSQGSKFRVLLQDSTEHCLKEVFVFDASNERSVENLAPGATGVEDNAAVET